MLSNCKSINNFQEYNFVDGCGFVNSSIRPHVSSDNITFEKCDKCNRNRTMINGNCSICMAEDELTMCLQCNKHKTITGHLCVFCEIENKTIICNQCGKEITGENNSCIWCEININKTKCNQCNNYTTGKGIKDLCAYCYTENTKTTTQ